MKKKKHFWDQINSFFSVLYYYIRYILKRILKLLNGYSVLTAVIVN